MALHVVHGIVKPQRQGDFRRMRRRVALTLEMLEAFAEVLLRVIAALRFCVGREQPIAQREVGRGAQCKPGGIPRREAGRLHHGAIAARISRPSSITDIA